MPYIADAQSKRVRGALPKKQGRPWSKNMGYAEYIAWRRTRALLRQAESVRAYSQQPFFDDDFFGDNVSNRWRIDTAGGGSAATIDEAGGILQMSANNNNVALDHNGKHPCYLTDDPVVAVEAKLVNTTQVKVAFGLVITDTTASYVLFENDPVGSVVDWFGTFHDGTTRTTVSLALEADTNMHVFSFQVNSTDDIIWFFVDGQRLGAITASQTGLSATVQPYLYFQSKTAAARTVKIDRYSLWFQRSATEGTVINPDPPA